MSFEEQQEENYITVFGIETPEQVSDLVEYIEQQNPLIFNSLDLEQNPPDYNNSNWLTFALKEFENENEKNSFYNELPQFFHIGKNVYPVRIGKFESDSNDSASLQKASQDKKEKNGKKIQIFRIPPNQQNLMQLPFEKKGILVLIEEFIVGPSNNLTTIQIKQMANKLKSASLFLLIIVSIWIIALLIKFNFLSRQ